MIEQERKGEQVDRPLLRSLVNMLSSVSLYCEFEQKLFTETEIIYQQEGLLGSGRFINSINLTFSPM